MVEAVLMGRRAARITAWIGLILVGALACTSSWSQENDWRLEKDRDGIRIYSRQVEGWNIREIRGVTQIDTRLSSIVAVIDDIGASRELVELVSEASLRDRESDTRYRVYSKMDMPFPLKDRDIFNQREIGQDDKTLAVTITDTATQGILPPQKGLIRIERSRQTWELTPTPEGPVRVELRILSDPAGPIPVSLINAMSVNTPLDMLSRLKELVRREKYAQAKLTFISEHKARL